MVRFHKATINVRYRWVDRLGMSTEETISVDGWTPEGGVNVAVIRHPWKKRGWEVVRASDGFLICFADSQGKARTVASRIAEAARDGQLDPSLAVTNHPRARDTRRALLSIKNRAIEEGLGY